MNRKSNKTTYTLLGITILAIAVLTAGWFYLQSRHTTIKIESDKPAYFTVDHPIVKIKLLNKKDTLLGEVGLKFNENVLKIADTKTSTGVTLRKLNNEYVFELGEDYFASNNEVIATLTLESLQPGTASFELDKKLSTLSNNNGPIEVILQDTSMEVGMAPDRGNNRKSKGNTGEFNSL